MGHSRKLLAVLMLLALPRIARAQLSGMTFENGTTLLGHATTFSAAGGLSCAIAGATVTCTATQGIGGTITSPHLPYTSSANTLSDTLATYDNVNGVFQLSSNDNSAAAPLTTFSTGGGGHGSGTIAIGGSYDNIVGPAIGTTSSNSLGFFIGNQNPLWEILVSDNSWSPVADNSINFGQVNHRIARIFVVNMLTEASDLTITTGTASSSNNVNIQPGATANSGTTTVNSPTININGSYFNGATGVTYTASLTNVVTATTPTGYLDIVPPGGSNDARIYNTGSLELANGSSAAVSASGRGAIRYNNSTTAIEISVNGGSYGGIPTLTANNSWTGVQTFSPANTSDGAVIIAPTVVTSGTQENLRITSAANTAQTASTEINGVLFDLSATRQWSSGAITTQREFLIKAPTYAFTASSTITTAVTLDVTGAPIAGTNATITTKYAVDIEAGDMLMASGTLYFTDHNNLQLTATGIDRNGSINIGVSLASGLAIGRNNINYTNGTAIRGGLGGTNITSQAGTTGTVTYLSVTGAASTGQTASTEINFVNYNLNQTVTWATGAITTERVFYVQAPTLAFAASSTITDAATVDISGAPAAGTNATITNAWALRIEGGLVGLPANATVQSISQAATNTTAFQFNPNVADGATSIAYDINNQTTLSTAGALLFRIRNNGSNIVQVDKNATMTLGSGSAQLNAGTVDRSTGGSLNLGNVASTSVSIGRGNAAFTVINLNSGSGASNFASAVTTSGTHQYFTLASSADTGQTASTEINGISYNLSATRQWATGNITTQREFLIQAPTYAFIGASTITDAATVDITGAPIAGSNATITNAWALRIEGGLVGLPANATVQSISQAATNTTAVTINSNVADGASSRAFVFNNQTSLNTTGSLLLQLQNNGNTKFQFDNAGKISFPASGNSIGAGSNTIVLTGTASTAGNGQITAVANVSHSTSGMAAIATANSNASTGQLYIAVTSGTASVYGYGENLTCSGTCTAGQAVVWAGTNQVSTAGATNNLTTIAGVALTTATNAVIVVGRHGRCLVNADAGITAGQLVGTSSATAGNVQSGTTPGAGAIFGRATEATSGTVSGQVIVDINLG